MTEATLVFDRSPGGDVSASIDLDFDGDGTNQWHVHDNSVSIWRASTTIKVGWSMSMQAYQLTTT